jgi:hypothetical protein
MWSAYFRRGADVDRLRHRTRSGGAAASKRRRGTRHGAEPGRAAELWTLQLRRALRPAEQRRRARRKAERRSEKRIKNSATYLCVRSGGERSRALTCGRLVGGKNATKAKV